MITFGERLKKERDSLGMSQTEFGNKAGVEKETQSNYERNKRFPKLDYLEQISLMGVDVQYVITGKRGINKPCSEAEREFIDTVELELKKVKASFEQIEEMLSSVRKK